MTKNFAKTITTLMTTHRADRKQLLARIEKSAATLSRIERGTLLPSDQTAASLLEALGASRDERTAAITALERDRRRKVRATYPHFAEALRTTLERAGVLASEAAAHLGVTQQALYLWKKGFALPSGDQLGVLVRLLDRRGAARADLAHLRAQHTYDVLMNDPRLQHLTNDERRQIAQRSSHAAG